MDCRQGCVGGVVLGTGGEAFLPEFVAGDLSLPFTLLSHPAYKQRKLMFWN